MGAQVAHYGAHFAHVVSEEYCVYCVYFFYVLLDIFET